MDIPKVELMDVAKRITIFNTPAVVIKDSKGKKTSLPSDILSGSTAVGTKLIMFTTSIQATNMDILPRPTALVTIKELNLN